MLLKSELKQNANQLSHRTAYRKRRRATKKKHETFEHNLVAEVKISDIIHLKTIFD